MINRRQILPRDPPFDFRAAFSEIRRLTGWGSGTICFVLNIPLSTLHSWEVRGSEPRYDDGVHIRKLLERCRAQSSLQIIAIAIPLATTHA